MLNTSKLGVWGSELTILCLSLLLARPIYIYTESYSSISNASQSVSPAILIGLHKNHFSSFLRINYLWEPEVPLMNQLNRFSLDGMLTLKFY